MARPGCGACGGIGTCEEVMECWCAQANQDQGIGCDDENRPHVKIGNCLVFGPNGEIAIDGNCLDENPPGPCEARVANLPDFIVGGSSGGAALNVAMGSPQALDYALDNNVDFVASHSFSLVGGIASWSPYDGEQAMDRYSIIPAGVTGFAANVSEWTSTTSDAGTLVSPTGRNTWAPDSYKDPDGGWYGFYAGQFPLMTAGDAIRRALGQTVIRFDVRAENPFGSWASDVDAILRSIQIGCAQANSMLLVPFAAVNQVEKIANAQVTPVVLVDAESDPAAITGAGGQWVEIEESAGNEQISRFVDAGLQVIVSTGSWQESTRNAQELGARGVICGDPVYARGLLNPPQTLAYRRITQTWVRRGTSIGELTTFTNQDRVLDARGFTKESEGAKMFWCTDSRSRWDQLMGMVCPIEDPNNYSIEVKLQVDGDSLPSRDPGGFGPRAGLVFGCDNDKLLDQDVANRSGYWAICLISSETSGSDRNGILRIGKYVDGESITLASSDIGRDVVVNEWVGLRLTIAGDTITWMRRDGANYQVSVTDTDYRGAYFGVTCGKSSDADGSFVCGFTDVSTVAVDAGENMAALGMVEEPATTVKVDDFDPYQVSFPPRPGM